MAEQQLDLFISYASEDRAFVRGLVTVLRTRGLGVWHDEHELLAGRSLREQIDSGLRRSRFGVVVISQSFFAKPWPGIELDGFLAAHEGYDRVLPIWLDVDHSFVAWRSPTLAARQAIVASAADADMTPVVEAIERVIAHQERVTGEAMSPLTVLLDVPEECEVRAVTYGTGLSRRRVSHAAELGGDVLAEVLEALVGGSAGVVEALPPGLLGTVLAEPSAQLPRELEVEVVAPRAADAVALWIFTDILYLQALVPTRGRAVLPVRGLLGRGGIAEFVTATGELRGSQRYGGRGVDAPHLIGPVGLVFATAFLRESLVARSRVLVCARRGIRLPTDIWTDPAGRPLWNSTEVPVVERRFAFESRNDRFMSTEIFTVDFAGRDLRQVTRSDAPSDNAVSDDEQGWVFAWETPTRFRYSRMRDGRHQVDRAEDEPG